jgi:threonine dehydratase
VELDEPRPAVTLAAIRAARTAIASQVRLTPVWPSAVLTRLTGVPVSLKCEQMQMTGSFKLRGATNFIRLLSAGERARGLVAASAGNHAQGVAYAGREQGIDIAVVMPESAPLAKVTAAREYGARVTLSGTSLEEARAEAQAIAAREGRRYVPPFDDDAVICGQGTLGLELLEQAPDTAEILVPTGGGGLLAGVGVAVKSIRPDIRVVGVQAAAMDGVRRSFAGRHITSVLPRPTIADGVAVAGPSARTLALIERYVDDIVVCSEESIARAILLLIEKAKMVVEGAGALAVAALQSGVYRPRGPVVAVLSGGNLDINLLGSVVHRGLVEAGRYRHLTLRVRDTPGALAAVAAAVAARRANVVHVTHDREAPGMPVGVATLHLLVEVSGEAHFEGVLAELLAAGYPAEAEA